ncbi:hypothetical protein C6A88_03325, partial [Mycolicibacterium austroafricanum]
MLLIVCATAELVPALAFSASRVVFLASRIADLTSLRVDSTLSRTSLSCEWICLITGSAFLDDGAPEDSDVADVF